MSKSLLTQHLFRAWHKHWALQIATVTVMTVVLMLLNFFFLSYSAFNKTIEQWGQGLEMIVYLKDNVPQSSVEKFQRQIEQTHEFEDVRFTSKSEATKNFLTALGSDSMELLSDPKWSSPIPSSFALRLSKSIEPKDRVEALKNWKAKLLSFDLIEDVFYGQGWVENFSRFLGSLQGILVLFWALSLGLGLLIVSNCIRLSFLQRRDEIEILELVGATPRFIRLPFLLEGLVLGIVASFLSLTLSYILHSMILAWLGQQWGFWGALKSVVPLKPSFVLLNLLSGLTFGGLGAWNCVRRLNNGWSAAAG